MNETIQLKPGIHLGVVPTHLRFVGCLVPDAEGRFPRDPDGGLRLVSGMREVIAASPVKPDCVQIPIFPGGSETDLAEALEGLRALGLEIYFIMMVGGANPMNPADEDAVVAQLVPAFRAAVKHGVRHVSSTSIEEWMSAGETERTGAAFEAAVSQNVKLHLRVYQEAGIEGSCVENWHIEFLRPGEFRTFTNLERGWSFVRAANQALGRNFFRMLVDASHCGNSGLSIDRNAELIGQIAAAGELGIFHASAITTRGCHSTDDGWIGALLAAMARTGCLRHVFVEMFDHADDALQALRDMEPGFGVDTRDGRSYNQVVVDGLINIARRLNNLHARGILGD